MKKTKLDEINSVLSDLFGLYSLEYKEPGEINVKMREALARLYAEEGVRTYLENAIRVSMKSVAVKADHETLLFYKGRITTLMQLLAIAKDSYQNFERLKKLAKK